MKSYTIKSTVLLSVTFTDTVTNLPVDPSTVVLRIYEPDGTKLTYNTGDFTHPSTGLYQKKIIPDFTGVWWYRWQGIGVADATFEKSFEVRPSIFIDSYRLTFEPIGFISGFNSLTM